LQAIGQEGHEDVGLDPVLVMVVDRTDRQVVLQLLEGLLDLSELHIEGPQLSRIVGHQVGAQQVTPLAPAHLPQFAPVKAIHQSSRLLLVRRLPGVLGQGDADQACGPSRLLPGGTDLHQQLIPRQLLALQRV
jgi:hypothetical protein